VIILQSINGASSTIIKGFDYSYTVTFSGSLAGTTLEGFTITHTEGSARTGSGVYIFNSNLTINECTISGNSTDYYGGGIGNEGTLDITSSDISGNDVSQQGGGIYLEGTGTITIGGNSDTDPDNNTFTDNKKDGTVSADQHIRDSSGDCRSSYPNNYYNPN